METLNLKQTPRTLDLGCGAAKRPNSIGVDKYRGSSADIIADMDAPHLPFRDGVFDSVSMTDALEHTADVLATLSEIARILKPGGVFNARVPHFTSIHAFSDFTHRQFFSVEALRHITGGYPGYAHYDIGVFKVKSVRILMWRAWRMLGIEALANAFPSVYEKLFAFWFPAMAIEFCLGKRG
jgi:SAM-dependent methyltransferase